MSNTNVIQPETNWNGERVVLVHNNPNAIKLEFKVVAKDFYGVVWMPMAQVEGILDGVTAAAVTLGGAIRDAEGRITSMQVSAGSVYLAYDPEGNLMVGFCPAIMERFIPFDKERLKMALTVLTAPENIAPLNQRLQYALGRHVPESFPFPQPFSADVTPARPFLELASMVLSQPISLPRLIAEFDSLGAASQRETLNTLGQQNAWEMVRVITAGRFLLMAVQRKDWARLAVMISPTGNWSFGIQGKARTRDEYIPQVCQNVFVQVRKAAEEALAAAM